jgi:hypothetical protein
MATAPLRSGLGEFYFETARAISSITASSTFLKFPNIHWRISHGAGAFPDISERFLLGFPNISDQARQAYKERFWYDSAGPVFPKQIKGLTEGMGIGSGQFVFGTVSVLHSKIVHLLCAFANKNVCYRITRTVLVSGTLMRTSLA